MSAFDYFKRGYTEKFATFTGRARRREYWFFTLFTLLFFIALGVVGAVLGSGNEDVALGVVLLGMLVSIIPSIAVQVRRLHDVGRSGWFILLNLIPYVGPLVLLVFMVLDSQPGDNRFGPNPKT